MELTGKISDEGKLNLFNRAELTQWLRDNAGKDIVLKIERKKKKRSGQQSRYYWGVVIAMVRQAMNEYGSNYSSEETHEYLKKEFNWTEIEAKDGYMLKVPQSTTGLTTVDFMNYLDKIYLWALEVLGIVIPLPNEQMELPIDTHIVLHDPAVNAIIHDKI